MVNYDLYESVKKALRGNVGKLLSIGQLYDVIEKMAYPNSKTQQLRTQQYYNRFKPIIMKLENEGIIQPHEYMQAWTIMSEDRNI